MPEIPYFDAHCDTLSRKSCPPLRENGGQLDLRRLRAFSKAGQLFAVFADASLLPRQALLPEFRRQARRFFDETERNADLVDRCRTRADAEAAFAAGRTAAFLSVEGAELLDCDPGRLEEAEQLGVRAVNLTWNNPNRLSGANRLEAERGLSPVGRDFVREAGRRNILVDVSHLSERGFWDLMDVTERPVLASHSCAKALCPHPRNLTDEQFRALRETGGFVGMNLYTDFIGGDGSLDAVVAHIEHFWELDGEDTLGLGGDWDGCDSLAGGFAGIQDLPRLYEALRRKNYGEALLNKFFCGNLLQKL